MKTLIAGLFLIASLGASAQVVNVYPSVFNFGNQAQVQIFNRSEVNVDCSGWLYLNTQLGRMESHYFSARVPKGFSTMRSFYLMNFQDRITFTHNSIYCRKAP